MTPIDESNPAAVLGQKGGKVKSSAKSEAAKARNAKRKAESGNESWKRKPKT